MSTDVIHLSLEDAIRKSAESLVIFGHTFLGRSFRQTSPTFHYDMSDDLLTPGNRLVAFKVFRGGAKTSIARAHAAFKPAYGLGNVGMIVSHDAAHAYRTSRWLMKQVEYNKLYANTFGLRKGSKWTPEWFEIINTKLDLVYSYVAMGITGSIRGVNLDDFRPDYILCDDILDPENVATVEQRKKVEDAFFGGLLRSLSPASESPLAQMVLLQTPLDQADVISRAEQDDRFKCRTYGCFDAAGQSRWPERWSTDELLKEKAAYIKARQLYIWMREMECQIISAEKCSFSLDWFVDFTVVPDGIEYVISIDPAPVDIDNPGEDLDRDSLVVTVVGFTSSHIANGAVDVWVEAQHSAKNEAPDETANAVFDFSRTYNTRTVIIEWVAYQRTLAWFIQEEMKRRRHWLTIEKFEDRRKKTDRIVQTILAVGPYGRLHVRAACVQLLTEAAAFGVGYAGHDDHLDSLSIALAWKKLGALLADDAIEGEFRRLREEDRALTHKREEDVEEEVRESGYQSCP